MRHRPEKQKWFVITPPQGIPGGYVGRFGRLHDAHARGQDVFLVISVSLSSLRLAVRQHIFGVSDVVLARNEKIKV